MKKIVMFLLALFVIAGCNNNEAFENAMREGKEAIANEEYDEALEFFESALEEKSDDEEAKILISQTEKMIEAINEKEGGNIAEAIALFEEVENMEDGYDKLSEQAKEKKEALAEVDNSTTTTSSSNKVFIDYATEELLGKYNSYDDIRIDEYGERVVFWSEKSISNFNFIEIGFENEDDNFSYFQEKILYSIDKLSPEKPVVIKTIISEGIPNRGISYTDESGNERYFYIAWSGYDDSLSLIEFENKIPDDSSSSNGSSNSDTSSDDSSSDSSSSNDSSSNSSSSGDTPLSDFDINGYLANNYYIEGMHYSVSSWYGETSGRTEYNIVMLPDSKEADARIIEAFKRAAVMEGDENDSKVFDTIMQTATNIIEEIPKVNDQVHVNTVMLQSYDGSYDIVLIQDRALSTIR